MQARELKPAEIPQNFGLRLNALWFQLLSLIMFWALFKSLLHIPCSKDEDKLKPTKNFFYYYTAIALIKIGDVTEESKNLFSGMKE